MLDDPLNVTTMAAGWETVVLVMSDRNGRFAFAPFFYFTVAIGKTEAAGPAM